MIGPETETFQGMFDTIVNFTTSKFDVKLIIYVFWDYQQGL